MTNARPASGYALLSPIQPRPPVGWVSYIANMYFIAVYAAALTPTLRSLRGQDVIAAGESDVGTTVSWVILLGLMIIWVFRNPDVTLHYARLLVPYLLIVSLCFISFLWSPYPIVTIRRTVTLTLCLVYGLYLFATFGVLGICRIIVHTMLTLGVLSILVYVAVPSVGHDVALTYSASLRGVFSTKNTAGEGMLLGICSAMYLGSRPGANKLLYAASAFFMLGIVAMTFSVTSALLSLIVVCASILPWIRNWRLRAIYVFCVIAGVAVVTFILVADSDVLFSAVGRDSSLTGRLPLWQMVFKSLMARPLLGYGYSGFWNADSTEVQYIWATIGWPSPAAHNGYLDIALQIGVIGVMLYLYMWAKVILFNISVTRLGRGHVPETKWIGVFMIVNILLNIDEGPLPYPDEFTMLMPACLIFLTQARSMLLSQRAGTRPAVLRTGAGNGRAASAGLASP